MPTNKQIEEFLSGNRPTTRDEFTIHAIRRLEYQIGIEVGVREGNFSRLVLESTDIRWFGVDRSLSGTARSLVERFSGRYDLRRGWSPGCASQFEDDYFDFIMIDAGHSYDDVAADLSAWWPKLKAGGCFSGDDYANTNNPTEGAYGVVEAVNEFADRLGLTLYVAGCADSRQEQLEFAKFHGEQATKRLHGQSHFPFQNPCWYIFKV